VRKNDNKNKYMNIKIVHTIVFLLITASSFAQQMSLNSQYNFNRFAFNPAYAGNKNRVEAIAMHRNHMLGFPGAPRTQGISITAPWQQKYMGFGLFVQNDRIGATNQLTINLAANYNLTLGPGKLAMGLELGIDQFSVDWSSLIKKDANDVVIPLGNGSSTSPNGAFGLFYTTENFYFGYSLKNMVGSRLNSGVPDTENAARKYVHHFINVGGVAEINDNFQAEPFLLIKGTKAARWQVDLGSYLVFKEKIGIGLAYRTGDALVSVLKIEFLDKFYLGYSYEAQMGRLKPFTSSSHEIMVAYCYRLLEPARKKVIHPRYYF
jgi:type IX secretion system PorP/SprF family membrane protein